MSNGPLSNKHAIVTGGSRGIGSAIAHAIAGAGADVTIFARNGDRLESAALALRETSSGHVHTEVVDVTDPHATHLAIMSSVEALGEPDILINNAGTVDTGLFVQLDVASWRDTLDSNLTSVFLCCREVLPGMMEREAGSIINIASTSGLEGYPYVAAYTAAKHAVVGLTKSLALEVASRGVRVNAVCPGFTDTDLITESAARVAEKTGRSIDEVRAKYAESNRGGRLILPEEVADKVLWFCLPGQEKVTGQVVRVDGSE